MSKVNWIYRLVSWRYSEDSVEWLGGQSISIIQGGVAVEGHATMNTVGSLLGGTFYLKQHQVRFNYIHGVVCIRHKSKAVVEISDDGSRYYWKWLTHLSLTIVFWAILLELTFQQLSLPYPYTHDYSVIWHNITDCFRSSLITGDQPYKTVAYVDFPW